MCTGSRPYGRRPLLVVLREAALADGASTLKRSSCESRTHSRSPAYRLAVGGCLHLPQPSRPLQGALVVANRLCRGLALVNAPADGLAIAGCPFKEREENRRGWPKLQPINYEPPSYL
ncbi:hypothetical protein B296_00013711 [Ensete ventricosum]|uniref:Uncharacterized protein n=1 Tax=Ensete ventricosum TaxID=4639 RepID=A0A426Y0K3_ENSVE|nr:hypothetical protein B296_00013711 [Ensete ventricosum]